MQTKKNKNASLQKMIVFFAGAIGLFVLIIWYGSSFLEILQLNQQKRELSTQISERQETSNQLNEEIAQIGTKAYIERIARNYLNLYYPDEQIVIPVQSNPNNGTVGADSDIIEQPILTPPQEVLDAANEENTEAVEPEPEYIEEDYIETEVYEE